MSLSDFSANDGPAELAEDREDNIAKISDNPGIPAAAPRPGGSDAVGRPAASRAAAAVAAAVLYGGEFAEDVGLELDARGLVNMEDADGAGCAAKGGGWDADLMRASRNFISSVFLFMPAQ